MANLPEQPNDAKVNPTHQLRDTIARSGAPKVDFTDLRQAISQLDFRRNCGETDILLSDVLEDGYIEGGVIHRLSYERSVANKR